MGEKDYTINIKIYLFNRKISLNENNYLVKRDEQLEEMFLEISFTKKHQRHLTKL